jgi:uncharacterized protein (DUF736 family)
MNIGNFAYDHANDAYSGNLLTLTLAHFGVVVSSIPKAGENGPEYRVLYQASTGEVEIGKAWKRNSEKGRDYLSVVLDDPSFAAPIYARMFLAADETTATLVWNRQQARVNADTAKAPTGKRKIKERVTSS